MKYFVLLPEKQYQRALICKTLTAHEFSNRTEVLLASIFDAI